MALEAHNIESHDIDESPEANPEVYNVANPKVNQPVYNQKIIRFPINPYSGNSENASNSQPEPIDFSHPLNRERIVNDRLLLNSPAHLLKSERAEILKGLKEMHEMILRQEKTVKEAGQLNIIEKRLNRLGRNKAINSFPIIRGFINRANLKKSNIDNNSDILERQYEIFQNLLIN